jgi:hypothetical protein
VTLGNTDSEIGGLTISDPPTRAEVQALNDGLVAAITLLNELRAAPVEK